MNSQVFNLAETYRHTKKSIIMKYELYVLSILII